MKKSQNLGELFEITFILFLVLFSSYFYWEKASSVPYRYTDDAFLIEKIRNLDVLSFRLEGTYFPFFVFWPFVVMTYGLEYRVIPFFLSLAGMLSFWFFSKDSFSLKIRIGLILVFLLPRFLAHSG